MKITKTMCVALAFALALFLSGCEMFENLGGREDPTGSQNDSKAVNKMKVNGGTGGLEGGSGGQVMIMSQGYNSIHVVEEREFDDSFELPQYDPNADLGPVPIVISSNTEVLVLEDHSQAEVGQVYFLDGEDVLYKMTEEGWIAASGLRVNEGKTLTLNPNVEDNTIVAFQLDYDLDVKGKIRTGLTYYSELDAPGRVMVLDGAGLVVECLHAFMGGGAMIDTSGEDAPADSNLDGGQGGIMEIIAYFGLFSGGDYNSSGGNGDGEGDGGNAGLVLLLSQYGVVSNTGSASITGGEGYDGGEGNLFQIQSKYHAYNKGKVTANGGKGTSGYGGGGGGLYMMGIEGGCFNSGNVDAEGGEGALDEGGHGGIFYLMAGVEGYYGGAVVNSGGFEGSGGKSAEDNGGGGGEFRILSYGPNDVVNRGRVIVNGGDCVTECGAGNGGGLFVQKISVPDFITEAEDAKAEAADDKIKITFYGKVDANGGNCTGECGSGNGGYVQMIAGYEGLGSPIPAGPAQSLPLTMTDDFQVELIGFNTISVNGGEASLGGNAGIIRMLDLFGSVLVDADLEARGGKGRVYPGGNGGAVWLYSSYMMYDGPQASGPVPPVIDELQVLGFNGTIDARGGDGYQEAGHGGWAQLWGWNGVGIKGDVLVSGGNGLGGDAHGGSAGLGGIRSRNGYPTGIDIASQNGDVYLSGTFAARGGKATGAGTGGNGAYIEVGAANQIKSRSTLDVRGGDGDMTSGFGGNGATVYLFSYGVATDHEVGAWIRGGNASVNGAEGSFWVDDVLIDGQMMP